MHIVQALMRPINSLNPEQVVEAISQIQALIDSKRYPYDLTVLTERLKDLQERKDFEDANS